eukprot:5270167-Prymnesium_polylepis.1
MRRMRVRGAGANCDANAGVCGSGARRRRTHRHAALGLVHARPEVDEPRALRLVVLADQAARTPRQEAPLRIDADG